MTSLSAASCVLNVMWKAHVQLTLQLFKECGGLLHLAAQVFLLPWGTLHPVMLKVVVVELVQLGHRVLCM